MKKGKSTRAIHGRQDQSYLGVNFPIFQTTSFRVQHSDDYEKFINDEEEFYIYTRYANPTIRNVEEKLAKLENTEKGLVFASGMAAITSTILTFVKNGDTVAASRRLYGMAYRFLRDMAPRFGIRVKFLDEDELYRINEIVPEARIVYFETPINPTTDCLNIREIVAVAKKIDALTIIDNTFASPINQNPANLGVDLVVHSATKYIGGHSDIMAGAVVGPQKLVQQVRETMKALGGCINPVDAYLLDRSLKTLKIRVEAQNIVAHRLAEFFTGEEKVQRVYYPGLSDSASHSIAKLQMSGFGGMLTIELRNLEAAKKFCDHLTVGLNATSLGGVETLVSIPVLTSHIRMSPEELATARVNEGMVRISAGIEDVDDLINDFKAALAQI